MGRGVGGDGGSPLVVNGGSERDGGGMRGVVVDCRDMRENSGCEVRMQAHIGR